jgi:hypothetical protein
VLRSGASSPTRFVIVATQRTGSTWLADTLGFHPAIASYEALLMPAESHSQTWGRTDREFFYAYYAQRAGHGWPLARTFWCLRYLEELYSPRPETDAVGMKVMYSQLKTYPWLLGYLALRRVRVIHLVRTNLLDVVVSDATAQARRQYHALASDFVDRTPVDLEPQPLVSRLERLQQQVNIVRLLLRLLPTPTIEITYEELTHGNGALDHVVRFLGVEPRPLTSRLTKLNRDTKQALIANYADVECALRGTRFERFLAD